MFKIGDYIVCGNNGVCIVDSVGPVDVPGIPSDKIYYTLIPHNTNGKKIFTPVDNERVIMRPVIDKDEALNLINDIINIDSLWDMDKKRREQAYKEAFQKCDCRELIKIIKTIYLHSQSRLAEGKKVTAGDERYFQMAEDRFYGELSIPFQMDKEEVKEFVTSRVEELTAENQNIKSMVSN